MQSERWFQIIRLRLRSLFRASWLEQELDEEISYHLECKAKEFVAQGMEENEARQAALRSMDGIDFHKEECRDARGISFIETLLQDVRYGVRMLRKAPGYTFVAVLTLALGIGANTAIFSLVDGILVSPLPYSDPERLVSVTGFYPQGAFVAMREQLRTMATGVYVESREFNLTRLGEPLRLNGAQVSAELLSILGVQPELGRLFRSGEDIAGRDHYVILSHSLWEQRFARDPAVIGRVIELEGVGREVVGILPADLHFPTAKTQVWVPLHNDPGNVRSYWAADYMPVIGRLRPGITIDQARAEIRTFQSRVRSIFPWPMPASWNADVSVVPLQSRLVGDVRTRLLMLLGAVALILLIACTNVANLTLSRAASRDKELALRTAIGADRKRIVRQLLTESLLLALLGGLFGLLLATQGISLLKAVLPADTPRLNEVHIHWRVLLFTGGLAILTGLLFGLAPALQSSRVTLAEALKAAGRAGAIAVSHRLRSCLAIAEVSLAVLLVIAAGLLIRSFWALSHVNPGFGAQNVLTARITPNQSFCSNPSRCQAFYRDLLNQVKSVPGISAAAFVNTLPLGGEIEKRSFMIEGHTVPPSQPLPLFWLDIVTPDYFRVMDIPLLAGRGFTDSDLSGNAAVAIVSAATARRFWPGQDAIGRHFQPTGQKEWFTIVGVVPDVRAYDLQRNVPEWMNGTAYLPYNLKVSLEDGSGAPAEMTIALQTNLDQSQVEAMLRRTVGGLNQEVPVVDVRTMRTVISGSLSTPASTAKFFAAFAALALVLGIVGIYGVLSFLVSRRTREIGIRLALGAQRRNLLWLVMKEAAIFSLAGVSMGLLGALAASRFFSSELYGVGPVDPATYGAAAVLMTLVTLLASYVPTRRAMRVDPLVALRYE
jgi:predicted permease